MERQILNRTIDVFYILAQFKMCLYINPLKNFYDIDVKLIQPTFKTAYIQKESSVVSIEHNNNIDINNELRK